MTSELEAPAKRRAARRALTRAEVLLVGLTLALVGLLLLPTLARGQHSRQATCLQNLASIGLATQVYAEDDAAELLLPIHQMMVNNTDVFAGEFGSTIWSWRTVNWFAWGGATASERFLCHEGGGPYVGQGTTAVWGAQTRPLTRYLHPYLSEDPGSGQYVFDVPAFHCPQDVGYPDDPYVDDAPIFNAERPCYTTLGNSYRANMNGTYSATAGGAYTGAFSHGPWGHKRSDLVNTSRVVLIGEPIFFGPLGWLGWHGEVDSDNVLYVDGSAHLTLWTTPSPISPDPRLPLHPAFVYQSSRADQFQFDCYPTPGAFIWAAAPHIRTLLTMGGPGGEIEWPYAGYKENLTPVPAPWLPGP